MKKFFYITLLISLNANANFDFLTNSKIVEMFSAQVAKQHVNVDLNILTLPLATGITEALHAKASSQPSYVNGYYTRLDQINLSTYANLNAILGLTNIPFGFNLTHGSEVIFARQFKTQSESIMALPYNLISNFPINADKAINNLNIGDFVSFHANLNFVVSRGFLGFFDAGLYANSGAYALVSGDFLINLYKIDNNKVRVKFIANRGKGIGVNASAGFSSPLKVIGFNYINRRIVDFINISSSAQISRNISDIFLIDLTFDLSDEKTAKAYTHLMSTKAVFKDLSILNPLQRHGTIASKLLTDMSEVEEIFTSDRNHPPSQRRIDRLFKGSNTADIDSSGISVGLKIFNFNNGKSFVRNQITNINKDDVTQKYLFDVYSKNFNINALWNTFGKQEIVNSNMLLTANEDWTPGKFIALALSRELRLVNFSENDLSKIKNSVKQLLPNEQYEQIDWKDWNFHNKDLLNAAFKHTLFFHKDAISEIKDTSSAGLRRQFREYLEKGTRPSISPQISNLEFIEDPSANFATTKSGAWIDQFKEDINKISDSLAISFSKTATSQERYDAFLQVKDFPLFLEKGAGFLVSILPPEKRAELISYEMELSAADVLPVKYKFGKTEEESLYKSMLYIQSIINNRSFDLRLYTDENGEFKPN